MLDPLSEILPLGVLSASILGSGHCAGMCGPFTLLFPGEKKVLLSYHIARGLIYGIFGGIAGAVGSVFFQTSFFQSLPWLGTLFFVLYFLFLARQIWTGQTWHIPLPKNWSQFFLRRFAHLRNKEAKAFGIGLASVLLPCGWLYSFLLAAVGTHSFYLGVVTMLVFWLGTLPALTLAPTLISRLLKGKKLSPRWSAVLFFCLSISALSLKLVPWLSHGGELETVRCHGKP